VSLLGHKSDHVRCSAENPGVGCQFTELNSKFIIVFQSLQTSHYLINQVLPLFLFLAVTFHLNANQAMDKYIKGIPPSLLDAPTQCRFIDRCPLVIDKCKQVPPKFKTETGYVRCWLYEDEK